MVQKFKDIQMSRANQVMLHQINDIIKEYQDDGYTLTLRQLYYQLVSRDMIANDQKQYKKLGRLLMEGRLAGIVDWEAIEDRLRQVSKVVTFDSPRDILDAARRQFKYDRLQGQEVYMEVWVEKDALSQVVERAARAYQIPVMVNRGYGSISMMYDAFNRFQEHVMAGRQVIVLYLGDHDPSGLDMVRDINDRVLMLLSGDEDAEEEWEAKMKDEDDYIMEYWEIADTWEHDEKMYQTIGKGKDSESYFHYFKAYCHSKFTVEHIALTMDQIKQYSPPPNPAKVTDTRAKDYIAKHGAVSWEVDALEPQVLNELITSHIEEHIDTVKYNEWKDKEKGDKEKMKEFIKSFE